MTPPADKRSVCGHKEIAISTGLCYATVCTSLPLEEVAAAVNRAAPTGISSPWGLSSDETFADGEPNPCVCPDHPETHKHYLLEC